jgi:hypothetical protein
MGIPGGKLGSPQTLKRRLGVAWLLPAWAANGEDRSQLLAQPALRAELALLAGHSADPWDASRQPCCLWHTQVVIPTTHPIKSVDVIGPPYPCPNRLDIRRYQNSWIKFPSLDVITLGLNDYVVHDHTISHDVPNPLRGQGSSMVSNNSPP